MEVWTSLVSPAESKDPRSIARRAREFEIDGWSGAIYPDSQLMAPESYALLAWCAAGTSTMKLGTGTGNPATRHPSVIASAAATLQIISEGRMTLSVGRGDSSLAFVGVPPVPLGYFERSLAMLQSYLRGEPVATVDAAAFLGELDCGFDSLAINDPLEAATMDWTPQDYRKPELDVAASGPKVIAMAAKHADRISFSLGADNDRLKWAIDLARDEATKNGREAESLSFSAYIPCYPHHDIDVARQLAQGLVASHSRFSVMHKKVEGPVSEMDRSNLERVAASYSMKKHGQSSSQQASVLDPDFIDRFALVGDPLRAAERVLELKEIGIDRVILWTGGSEGAGGESYRSAADELLPAVRAAD